MFVANLNVVHELTTNDLLCVFVHAWPTQVKASPHVQENNALSTRCTTSTIDAHLALSQEHVMCAAQEHLLLYANA